jgi:hypothetical protein
MVFGGPSAGLRFTVSSVWSLGGLKVRGYPLRPVENSLAGLAIGDIFVRKADGGRRPKAIREIPDHYFGKGRLFLLLGKAFAETMLELIAK